MDRRRRVAWTRCHLRDRLVTSRSDAWRQDGKPASIRLYRPPHCSLQTAAEPVSGTSRCRGCCAQSGNTFSPRLLFADHILAPHSFTWPKINIFGTMWSLKWTTIFIGRLVVETVKRNGEGPRRCYLISLLIQYIIFIKKTTFQSWHRAIKGKRLIIK